MSFNTAFFLETFVTCLKALPVTLRLAGISFVLASIAGFGLALVRIRGKKVPRAVVTGYISVIRGVPLVVQILVVYSMLPGIFQSILDAAGSSFRIYDLNPIVYAYIVFTLNASASTTEIFRSAIQAVDPGQLEAAGAAGLNVFSAYTRIIIPQALVSALPNLCTTATGLVKMSSLAFLMTVKDITGTAKIAAAYGYNYIEAYTDIWVLYILICLVIEIVFRALENRGKRFLQSPAG